MNVRSRTGLLTAAAALLLALSVIGVVYVALTPAQTGQSYTEFSVLGANGSASGYPTDLAVGETGTARVVVVNHENRPVTYRVVAALGGDTVESYSVRLADGERDAQAVSFTPAAPGNETLRLRLYRGEEPSSGEPYRTLRLDIAVSA